MIEILRSVLSIFSIVGTYLRDKKIEDRISRIKDQEQEINILNENIKNLEEEQRINNEIQAIKEQLKTVAENDVDVDIEQLKKTLATEGKVVL